MGSDTSPQVLFEAVLQAVDLLESSDTLVIFATRDVVDSLSVNLFLNKKNQIEFRIVKDVISMSDEPLLAVRQKKKSSIVLAIKELKKRSLDAFVSAGNTGALIATCALYLTKFPGIQRPALLAVLPTQKSSVAVIDVGGNISCKAHHLAQFAEIGSAYQACNLDILAPKVGLLNIGTESKKGTLEVRQAYEMLKDKQNENDLKGLKRKMEFVGNIEGKDVFQGKVDVLVTSGVTGNVLLKTAEGVASFIFDELANSQNAFSNEGKKYFEKLQGQFNYAEYPGAIISGIDGIVIKCHGYATARAMYNSIKGAITLHRKDFLSKIKDRL
jgi:glycerol-3-phosphate acyltransferase PlsX